MIIRVPLEDKPFHDDSEWPNWQGFIQWFQENSDWAYFIHLLLSDPQFRSRFYQFMRAAQEYEQALSQACHPEPHTKAEERDMLYLSLQLPST